MICVFSEGSTSKKWFKKSSSVEEESLANASFQDNPKLFMNNDVLFNVKIWKPSKYISGKYKLQKHQYVFAC